MKRLRNYLLLPFVFLFLFSCNSTKKIVEVKKPIEKINIAPNNALLQATVLEINGDNAAKINIDKYLSIGSSFHKPNDKIIVVKFEKTKIQLKINQKFQGEISASEQMGGIISYKLLYSNSY